jgi:hypothetical protein
VIVVGMGQKQAADIRPSNPVPLHSFFHTFQFAGIARIYQLAEEEAKKQITNLLSELGDFTIIFK